MAEDDIKFICKILEDLTEKEMRKLKLFLNEKNVTNNNQNDIDAIQATKLFLNSFDNPLEELECILDDIPRKDLIKKIRAKIEADSKNKGEAQNNGTPALIQSFPGSSDRPPYTGKYTLCDLEDYATKNQDSLIMHLKNILEPDEYDKLEKELLCSMMNKSFSFTAKKYYELYKNGELKEFLNNISGKPNKIPMILLNILFTKKNNNRKRKAQKQMQRQGNTNFKKKQFVNTDDEVDDNVPDKVTLGIENEKINPIHPNEHKPGNEDSNVIEKHYLFEDSRMATENYENIESEKIIQIHPNEHKPSNEDSNVIEKHYPFEDSRMATENYENIENEKIIQIHPNEHKPSNEDSNVIEKHYPFEDSRMAVKNWYENKKNIYKEISLNYICIREHKAYSCFKAQDVLQFRMPHDPDYRILEIVQEERDFTQKTQKLKMEVEFALQFNMAVLDVQVSEVISSKGFVREIRANGTFTKAEYFLKNIVFELVLPVLALYKWANLNAFENALYPNKESTSSFNKKLHSNENANSLLD